MAFNQATCVITKSASFVSNNERHIVNQMAVRPLKPGQNIANLALSVLIHFRDYYREGE